MGEGRVPEGMSMKRSLLSGSKLVMAFLIMISTTRSAVAFLPQNTKITFDTTNTLIFEDVGRHDGFSGDHILLHVTRDGKPLDINLAGIMKNSSVPLAHQVEEIRYRDRDRIWIISRLGHRLNGVVLFNIMTQKVEWQRDGVDFSLSPDARHVAYSYPMAGWYECPAVFVNTVMVYPKFVSGFTGPGRLGGPEKEDGTHARNFLPPKNNLMTLASEIKWLSNGSIQFNMRPCENNTSTTSSQTICVTGLEDLKKTESIKVSVVPYKAIVVPSSPKPSKGK